ncbi:MAG: hypothetical protein WC761_00515 [Candidatus Paceibacterota bacterium]|jgi:hypothetical protein
MGCYTSRFLRYKHFKEYAGPGVRTVKVNGPTFEYGGKTYLVSSMRILIGPGGNLAEKIKKMIDWRGFADGIFFYEETDKDYDKGEPKYWEYGKGDYVAYWFRVCAMPPNCTLKEDQTR